MLNDFVDGLVVERFREFSSSSVSESSIGSFLAWGEDYIRLLYLRAQLAGFSLGRRIVFVFRV